MSDIREIVGNTTATPTPPSDWNQTDETKADYIKNKPDINAINKQITLIQEQINGLEKDLQMINEGGVE